MSKQTIESLVDGGNASGGPPLGPALGPTGVNIGQVVDEINKKTKDMSGMKIPVKVIVDASTKTFEIEVGSPPTSALIKKELNIEKGAGDNEPAGDLIFDSVIRIARLKKGSLLAEDFKGTIKEVIGTCQSVGVTIDGKSPKEITAEINEGKLDDRIKTGETGELAPQPEAEKKPEKPPEKKEESEGEESEGEESEGEEPKEEKAEETEKPKEKKKH